MLVGSFLALASALFWSIANVVIQPAARRFGTFGSLFWAQVAGALVVIPIALAVEGRPGALDGPALRMLGVGAVAACFAYAGLFDALRRGRISVVAPLVGAWPVLSALIGVVWLGERPSGAQTCGIALVVLGNVTLARFAGVGESDRREGRTGRDGLVSAVIAMIGFGCLIPAVKVVGDASGPLWAVLWVWGAELALAAPVLAALGYLRARPRDRAGWLVALRPGLFEIAGFVCLSLAVRHAPVSSVSPLSSLSTALSVAWGLLVVRERLSRVAVAGAVAASIGGILVHL